MTVPDRRPSPRRADPAARSGGPGAASGSAFRDRITRLAAAALLAGLAACGNDATEQGNAEGPSSPGDASGAAEGDDASLTEELQALVDEREGRGRPGNWKPVRGQHDDLTDAEREAIAALEGLGYVGGVETAGDRIGVTIHDAARVESGLNLVVSGHGPEALLVDMDGERRHAWSLPFESIWPGRAEREDVGYHSEFYRRARVLPDGSLLAIFEGLGLVKLSAESELLWSYDGGAHHDLRVQPNGRIWVLTRRPRIVEAIDPEHPVLEDHLTLLDADGNELQSVSLLECALASRFSELFARKVATYQELVEHVDDGEKSLEMWGDVFHTNSLQVLDGSHADVEPAFAAGHLLVSIRNLNLLAVVDPRAGQIVWVMRGDWRMQHDATLLKSGRILLFDNKGRTRQSAVLEVDPVTEEVAWSYRADEPGVFYSARSGVVQRLPSGNTLVVESNAGRAFELTPDGTIVWEFHNPERAGNDGEFIANLFDVVRLPPDFPTDWLGGR